MRFGAMTRIGLKSPNSLSHDIPSVLRRTVNVSERVQGVSISDGVLVVGGRLKRQQRTNRVAQLVATEWLA